MADLKGKTVVVLGASSEGGSGWVAAELSAARGANVVVGARTFAGVEKLAARINGLAVQCDASVESEVEEMAAAAKRAFGPIDIAICAAGNPIPGTIDSVTADELQRATAINFFGPFYFCKHMSRSMNDGGSVVIVSSSSSYQVTPGVVAYACAKAAANALVRYAALELAPRGIRVNGILAGWIDSPMTASMTSDPAVWAAIAGEVPLGRPVEPRQIGQTCLWLSSADAAVTGEMLLVDNGMHLRRSPMEELSAETLMENNRKLGFV